MLLETSGYKNHSTPQIFTSCSRSCTAQSECITKCCNSHWTLVMAVPLKSLIIATFFSGFISLSFSNGQYLRIPATFARCMYGARESVCVHVCVYLRHFKSKIAACATKKYTSANISTVLYVRNLPDKHHLTNRTNSLSPVHRECDSSEGKGW